jgi:hypothetical protein
MSYQWSRNAAHIQSLFRPWKTGDGWDETSVENAERMLSVRFPTILRNFYLSWGKRTDYTRSNDVLLDPKETFEHFGHLVFCIENQAVNFWGVPIHQLDEPDPPVNYIYNEKTDTEWKPSHKQLTFFLDALFYSHAFAKGAVHGASARAPEEKWDTIEGLVTSHYTERTLESAPWGIRPSDELYRWTLYIQPGIAIDISSMSIGLFVTAQTEKAIQDLGNLISVNWEEVW